MKLTKIFHVIAAFSLLSSVATTAKSESVWDIEYLPAGDYESAFGIGFYQAKNEGMGFYGNFQITLSIREPHYDSLNISSFGDPVTDRYKEIMLFNFGITKKVTSNIIGYAGVGFVSVTGIAQKDDRFNILASNGKYYVNDSSNDETSSNLNTGFVFGTENISFNIGYHSFTNTVYFGVGSRF